MEISRVTNVVTAYRPSKRIEGTPVVHRNTTRVIEVKENHPAQQPRIEDFDQMLVFYQRCDNYV